jgi:sec-independent protein translocase protein TatA
LPIDARVSTVGRGSRHEKDLAMNFFGMGTWEIMIILIAALVIFGPNRLPEIAGKMGKTVRDLRQMSTDLTSELEKNSDIKELRKTIQGEFGDAKNQLSSVGNTVKKDVAKAGTSMKSTIQTAASTTAKTTSTPKTSTTTAAKSTTSTAAKSTASTTGKSTAAAKPAEPVKASKKDPFADFALWDAPAADTKPAAAASAPTAAKTVPDVPASSEPALEQVDALARARQRRAAAGYNRRAV